MLRILIAAIIRWCSASQFKSIARTSRWYMVMSHAFSARPCCFDYWPRPAFVFCHFRRHSAIHAGICNILQIWRHDFLMKPQQVKSTFFQQRISALSDVSLPWVHLRCTRHGGTVTLLAFVTPGAQICRVLRFCFDRLWPLFPFFVPTFAASFFFGSQQPSIFSGVSKHLLFLQGEKQGQGNLPRWKRTALGLHWKKRLVMLRWRRSRSGPNPRPMLAILL